jgi:phosphatidate cytidylyltransferase
MIAAILSITVPVFLAGAGLIALAARQLPEEQRRRLWLKYAVYVLVVHVVLATIVLGWFVVMAGLILLAGAVELVLALTRIREWALRCAIGVASLGLAGAFLLGTARLPQGKVAFLYLVVAGFDGFSEIFGRLLGRVRLARVISPGKTVEGAIMGGVRALILAVAAAPIGSLILEQAILMGAAIAVAALSGDLGASWVKRRAGIKDYSGMVPGHGGILDRFDSLIGAGAMTGLLFTVAR